MDVNAKHYLNKEICRAAMRCLFSKLNQHDKLHLKSLGVGNKLTYPLTQLTPREQENLICYAYRFFSFSIDIDMMEKEMQRVEIDQANYDLQVKFISLRATSEMMNTFFGFHTVEYSAWRKRLNLEGVDSHCVRYCNEDIEKAIWTLWKQYRHLGEQDCLLKIADESGKPLNLINKVIKRYNFDKQPGDPHVE